MLVAVVSAFFGSANENENWYKITCMGEHDCLLFVQWQLTAQGRISAKSSSGKFKAQECSAEPKN